MTEPLITPDDGSPSPYRRKIMKVKPLPGTHSGNRALLSCGHFVTMFGSLSNAPDGVICYDCKQQARAQ